MFRATLFLFLIPFLIGTCGAQNNTTVYIPYEYTYLLPGGFTYNLTSTFANGTQTDNQTLNTLLDSASTAPFISHSSEFSALLGDNPHVTRIAYQPGVNFAHEAGVWVPEQNSVYYSGSPPLGVQVLNLTTGFTYNLTTDPPILNPNGGYYFSGLIYWTTFADTAVNGTYRGGILTHNPQTGKVTTLLNSYRGLPFNGIDDAAIIQRGNQRLLYFTDFSFAHALNYTPATPSLPNSVWRFDFTSNILLPVISRTDIPSPNGVRVSPDYSTLYVTDSGGTANTPAYATLLGGTNASPAIYAYDIDANGFPVNRRLFGYAREGIPDGIHVDDKGRVWTGEGEGVVVRSPHGKVLGVFNSQFFLQGNEAGSAPLANFALAGDVVVVLGTQQLWTVKLAETVVGSGSAVVN